MAATRPTANNLEEALLKLIDGDTHVAVQLHAKDNPGSWTSTGWCGITILETEQAISVDISLGTAFKNPRKIKDLLFALGKRDENIQFNESVKDSIFTIKTILWMIKNFEREHQKTNVSPEDYIKQSPPEPFKIICNIYADFKEQQLKQVVERVAAHSPLPGGPGSLVLEYLQIKTSPDEIQRCRKEYLEADPQEEKDEKNSNTLFDCFEYAGKVRLQPEPGVSAAVSNSAAAETKREHKEKEDQANSTSPEFFSFKHRVSACLYINEITTYISKNILSIISTEKTRLSTQYGTTGADDGRIATLTGLETNIVNLITQFKDTQKSVRFVNQDLKNEAGKLKNNIANLIQNDLKNQTLDKHKSWGEKLGLILLNALFSLPIIPLIIKYAATGSCFFSLTGKSHEAAEQTYQVCNRLEV